jgi:hypothetical protein
MNLRIFIIIVLLTAGSSIDLLVNSAFACTCISSRETSGKVRQYIQSLYNGAENIVVLRAIKVTEIGTRHERSTASLCGLVGVRTILF